MEAWTGKSGHLCSWAAQAHRRQAGRGSKSLLVTPTKRNTFFYALRDRWKKPSSKGKFPDRKPGVNGNHSSGTAFLGVAIPIKEWWGTGILGCELSTISLASKSRAFSLCSDILQGHCNQSQWRNQGETLNISKPQALFPVFRSREASDSILSQQRAPGRGPWHL